MSALVVSAKWTEWMAKNRRRQLLSFDVCLSVHLCAEERPITVIKRLKLWSWNLTCMCPETVQTWNLKNFLKRGVARVMWPPNFWLLNANSWKMVKGVEFKLDKHIPREVWKWPLIRCARLCPLWWFRTHYHIGETISKINVREPASCPWISHTDVQSVHRYLEYHRTF